MTGFPHLRVRSSYSLQRGASDVSSLVKTALALGIPAMALTDHDNLFGALEFSKACMAKGIQPIMGLRCRVPALSGKLGFMTLLATDETGFKHLCSMVKVIGLPRDATRKTLDADVPRLSRDALQRFSGSVVCLWGGGEDGGMLGMPSSAVDDEARFLKDTFGDRLYAEICRTPGSPSYKLAAAEAEQLDHAQRLGLPLVGTVDTWYASKERHRAWVLLKAMSAEPRQELLLTDEGMENAGEPVFRLVSGIEAKEIFSDLPEAYGNAFELSHRCSFAAQGRAPMLPPFTCAAGRTEEEELRDMATKGMDKRLSKKGIARAARGAYDRRLEFELATIVRMGFPGYFLIVADFIAWAKAHDIPVGPGRGSGAGSVVAWALGITDLDPLEFKLLFERFLNPERVSMPDFDIDFCQDRRDEVIAYVREKYGASNVSNIATFGMLKGKSALRDVHRVVRHDKLGSSGLREIDYVSKLIPKKEDAADPMGLEEAYEKSAEFRAAVSSSKSPTIQMVYELAKDVEGLLKSRGLHAAGVVISDRPLESIIPVITDEDTGVTITGYSLKGVEEAGLVKFDFLGLTTLSIMKEACNHIKVTTGLDIDLETIPRDDPRVMAGLARGDATGVFQFETGGMRGVMRQVKPTTLEDLIAIVSLFRPGPMQFIPDYASRKEGASFEYPGGAERTERYLRDTFGIMVYQEQVMQVAQSCAGYSLSEADLLRRAMGKKQPAEMLKQKEKFLRGCVAGQVQTRLSDGSLWRVHAEMRMRAEGDAKGRYTVEEMKAKGLTPDETDFLSYAEIVEPAVQTGEARKVVTVDILGDGMTNKEASSLFEKTEIFAGYGFNRSHAAAYAWISYQTAWLRYHFPVEFYGALMTYCKKPEKRGMVRDDMTRHGVELLPPNINRSYTRFKPEMDGRTLSVRYGFCGIKGLPENMDWMEEERRLRGPFVSLKDFHSRLGKRLNKDHVQVLAAMGAFSELHTVRSQAGDILRKLDGLDIRSEDLFGGKDIKSEIAEWPNLPEMEFKSAGFYMSGHPLDLFMERLRLSPVQSRSWWCKRMTELNLSGLRERLLCVMVKGWQSKQSKKGTTFLQAIVEDQESTFQVNCFVDDESLAELREAMTEAKSANLPLIMECDVVLSQDGGQVFVNGSAAMPYDEYVANLDCSRDLAKIKLGAPEGVDPVQTLDKAYEVATRTLTRFKTAENDTQGVSIEFVCGNLSRRLEGRYPWEKAKPCLAIMPGVIKFSYLAEGMDDI